MTRHTNRSPAGRFTSASTTNAPEASEGRFATRTDLPVADESGADRHRARSSTPATHRLVTSWPKAAPSGSATAGPSWLTRCPAPSWAS